MRHKRAHPGLGEAVVGPTSAESDPLAGVASGGGASAASGVAAVADPFEFEQLEPRLLLSATQVAPPDDLPGSLDSGMAEIVMEQEGDRLFGDVGAGEAPFSYERSEDKDLYAVEDGDDGRTGTMRGVRRGGGPRRRG